MVKRKSYYAKYGQYPCIAHPTNMNGNMEDYFYVMLLEDPGFGSMSFPNIHRSRLTDMVEKEES